MAHERDTHRAAAARDDGPAERDDGPVERDDGPVERDDGPVERDDGPVERDDGPVERDDGPVERDDGPAERDDVDAIIEQWRRERPDLDSSPIGVIGRMSRLARALEQRLEPVYRAHGLEPGWHDVLATLRRSGPPYKLRASDFSGALMLTSSGTTKRLDRLEQAGLIAREPDPHDRRGTLIALTDAGRKLIDGVTGAHLANERRLLAALTDDEQRQLADLMRTLGLGLPPS